MHAIYTLALTVLMATPATAAYEKWKLEDCIKWAKIVVVEAERNDKLDPRLVEIVNVQMATTPSDDDLGCVGTGRFFQTDQEKIVAWAWAWSQEKGMFDLTYKIIDP